MNPLLAEFIGTTFLLTLGCGVVANVLLNKSKGYNSGWIVICFGWAMAVFVGVFVAAPHSGGHLNPAVTVGLAVAGKFPWQDVPMYVLAQLGGAMLGPVIAWSIYKPHYDSTTEADLILATFGTGPAIRSASGNFITEFLATFVFILAVLYIIKPESGLGSLEALPAAFLVLSIGLSLGGPTGYAINPARDLGPRIMHTLLPIPHKGNSDWGYAWIPILGPLAGAALAGWVFLCLQNA